MKTKQLGLLMVSMVAILMLPVGLALADTTTEGGVHEGVLVRHTFKIHQDKYDYATDLHFKITQKEPWIFVNGWRIKVSDFTNSSRYAYDPHGVQVDADGAKIPYCTWITIEVEFWLTDWNTLRISDVEWTKGPDAIKAIPSSGWTLDYPAFDPQSGEWLHKFSITNDDKTDNFIVSGLTFNVSKDWYANLTDVSFPPSPYPDFILGPGQSWQTDISTPEPFYGWHIYFKYNITDLHDGHDIVSINWADHPVTEPADAPETRSPGFVSGILALFGLSGVQSFFLF